MSEGEGISIRVEGREREGGREGGKVREREGGVGVRGRV